MKAMDIARMLFCANVVLASSVVCCEIKAQQPSEPVPAGTAVLSECDGSACKGTWTISNGQGKGTWTDGKRAELTVMRRTPTSIVIKRTDIIGRSENLSATYTGTIVGQKISGHVIWTWDVIGWPDNRLEGEWSAIILQGSMEHLTAASPEVQDAARKWVDRVGVCNGRSTREAMQVLEDEELKDHKALVMLRGEGAMMGVNPHSGVAKLVDSKTGNDNGYSNVHWPGAFMCRAMFSRGDAHVTARGTSESAREDASEINGALKEFPNFFEWFRITPISGDRFALLLVPATELPKDYSNRFTYA